DARPRSLLCALADRALTRSPTPSGFAEIVSDHFPSELRGELESQLQSQSFLNTASGETWTSARIEQRKEQIKEDRPARIKSIEAAQAKFTKYCNYRKRVFASRFCRRL